MSDAKKMRLLSFSAFYHDVRSLFGEGGITIITRNDNGSKIIIKSIIQADADVIHIINEHEINDNAWQQHALKIKRVCKRLHFYVKFLGNIAPLAGAVVTLIYSARSFQTESRIDLLIIITIVLGTVFAALVWSRFISYYVSQLPQKIFRQT